SGGRVCRVGHGSLLRLPVGPAVSPPPDSGPARPPPPAASADASAPVSGSAPVVDSARAPAPLPARVIRPPPRSASRPCACIAVYCGPIDAAARHTPPSGCDGGGVPWAERGWLRCVVTATG